ncbi:poly(A)-binding protein binding protein [Yamadazyma tenuis]|uniref:poly(A)-binding protein binding protein n=1 Tax=Candida tenuis TaxID=2315449 RepID=UPI002798BA43|nr:poly(A)-binding protein binding protein [Yamadazyma tenuis]
MKSQKLQKSTSSKAEVIESKFKTDADIANANFKERELEKWVPDADDTKVLTFDENSTGGWDQFRVNQEKFGIESTYDEHLYTTRINTEAKDFQERVKKAERLANEIENDGSIDPHILEERGKLKDTGLDEEMKYSGVLRDEDPDVTKRDTRGDELMAALKSVNISDKKYVPPKPNALNTAHKDPAIASIQKPSDKKHTEESFRLNAQSEINSLKEFSATFKVPHKLPNDLLPILAKDKIKQDEILKKSSTPTSTSASSTSPPPVATGTTSVVQKKKMDPTKPAFKLNPKAAAFTPSSPRGQGSPKPQAPKLPYVNNGNHSSGNNSRSPTNPSPRMNNQRPYSAGSGGMSKRHYQISPADFFGGFDRVPTKESQIEKSKKIKISFNLFVTAKRNTPKGEPVTIERAYTTPPTWKQTVDEPYYNLFPSPDTIKLPGSMAPSPYMQSPMVASPSMPGFPPQSPNPPGMIPQSSQSPQAKPQVLNQQAPGQHPQAMNVFQQQQYQAAMFYQQQLGMMPQAQGMPGMYVPTGGEFMMPGYMPPNMNYSGGSPNSPRMVMQYPYGNSNQHHQNYNGNHHRRYNQKRNE